MHMIQIRRRRAAKARWLSMLVVALVLAGCEGAASLDAAPVSAVATPTPLSSLDIRDIDTHHVLAELSVADRLDAAAAGISRRVGRADRGGAGAGHSGRLYTLYFGGERRQRRPDRDGRRRGRGRGAIRRPHSSVCGAFCLYLQLRRRALCPAKLPYHIVLTAPVRTTWIGGGSTAIGRGGQRVIDDAAAVKAGQFETLRGGLEHDIFRQQTDQLAAVHFDPVRLRQLRHGLNHNDAAACAWNRPD